MGAAANAALSQAKTPGRARVHVDNSSCAIDTAPKLRVASALREALATDQITCGTTTDITPSVNLSSPSFDSRLPRMVGDASRLAGWPLHQPSSSRRRTTPSPAPSPAR